jgi:hypothetical protein
VVQLLAILLVVEHTHPRASGIAGKESKLSSDVNEHLAGTWHLRSNYHILRRVNHGGSIVVATELTRRIWG